MNENFDNVFLLSMTVKCFVEKQSKLARICNKIRKSQQKEWRKLHIHFYVALVEQNFHFDFAFNLSLRNIFSFRFFMEIYAKTFCEKRALLSAFLCGICIQLLTFQIASLLSGDDNRNFISRI